MTQAFLAAVSWLLVLPASTQEVTVPQVNAAPGGGAAAGVVPGVTLPGGAPGAAGLDVTLRSALPRVDPIGPIIVPRGGNASANRGAQAVSAPGVAPAATGGVAGAKTAAPGQTAPAGRTAQAAPAPPGGKSPASLLGRPTAPEGAKPGGGGGAPVEALDVTVRAIDGARQAERKGDGAALGQTLRTVYEGDAARRPETRSFDDIAAAHGLAGLSPAEQVKKLGGLAETAAPADAPSLYRTAAERAARGLPAEDSARELKALNGSAARRAPEALKRAAGEAVAQAHAGALKGRELAKAQDAIDFWNGHAYLSGQPSLSNAADLKASIARLQEAASTGRPGRAKSAPKLRFEPDAQDPAAPRLRAVLLGGGQAPAAVARVPQALPEALAIADAARPSLELPGQDALLPAFRLEPPAGAGARAALRERRARGESLAGSLWAATRFWLASTARGLWRAAVRLVRSVLETVGLVDAAPRLGPGLTVSATEAQRAELRGAADRADPLAAGPGAARLLSGYRIGPSWARPQESEPGARVRLGRVPSDVSSLEARFAALEEIETRRRVGLRVLSGGGELTSAAAKAALAHAEAALEAFERLASDRPGRRLAASARSWLAEAERALARGEAPKPDSYLRLDQPSTLRLLETLAQAAADRVAFLPKTTGANLLLRAEVPGAGTRELAAIDLSRRPQAGERLLSPALRSLAALLAAGPGLVGSFVARDRRLWARLDSGTGARAELHAQVAAPDAGGLIRARLESRGAGAVDEARLYLAARVLYDLGLSVQVQDGLLSAVADGEHNALSPDAIEERLPVVLETLSAALRMDRLLPAAIEGTSGREELGRRLAEWTQAIQAEGTLPVSGAPEGAARSWQEYRRREGEREALRSAANRALREAGLPEIPPTVPIGQRTLDLRLNKPLEAALARGELRADAQGRVVRAPGYDPARRLVEEALASPRAAAELADTLASFGAGAFRFETIGLAGGLLAERAQRGLGPGLWLNLYALRDPASGRPLLARAELAEPGATRVLDAGRLLAFSADASAPVSGPGVERRLALLREPGRVEAGLRAPALAAAESSARPLVAALTYDKAKAAQGGAIFASPYTTASDQGAVRASRGLVLTSGAGSAHAALAARGGFPAVLVEGADWTEAGLRAEAVRFGPPHAGPRGVALSAVASRTPVTLREGAAVKLDVRRGSLALVPRDRRDVSLRASEALTAFSRSRDLRALTDWTGAQLTAGGLGELDKLALAEVLIEGAPADASQAVRDALVSGLGPGGAATVAAIEARLEK